MCDRWPIRFLVLPPHHVRRVPRLRSRETTTDTLASQSWRWWIQREALTLAELPTICSRVCLGHDSSSPLINERLCTGR